MVDFLTTAQELSEAAKVARADEEPDAAQEADSDMVGLLAELQAFEENVGALSPADQKLRVEIDALAKQTNRTAKLAVEEEYIRDIATSWKAKAYYGARRLTLSSIHFSIDQTLAALDPAYSAENTDALPKELDNDEGGEENWAQRQWTSFMESFVKDPTTEEPPQYAGATENSTVSTDTPLTVEALRALANNPARIPMMLSLGYAMIGKKEFAIYEIESKEVSGATDPIDIAVSTLLKSFIYSINDCPTLAVDKAESLSTNTLPQDLGAKFLAGLHLQFASAYLIVAAESGDAEPLILADIELGRAFKVWPDSPITQYLTGERLAANGQFTEAAESMEALLADTEAEWFAQIISERVREFRDAEPGTEQGFLYSNGKFVREVLVRYLIEESKNSEKGQQIWEIYYASIGLAQKVSEQLNLSLEDGDGNPSEPES